MPEQFESISQDGGHFPPLPERITYDEDWLDRWLQRSTLSVAQLTAGDVIIDGILTLKDPNGKLNTGQVGGPDGVWFGLTGGDSALVWSKNSSGSTIVVGQLGFTAASGARSDTFYSTIPLEFEWGDDPAITFTRGLSVNDTGIGGDEETVDFYISGTKEATVDADGFSKGSQHILTFTIPGTPAVQLYNQRIYPPWNCKITRVDIMLGTTASSGATTVDVNRNGTTIFTTQSNRPSIAAASYRDESGTVEVDTITKGTHYLQVQVDAAGTAAADLVVMILVTRT